MSLFIQNNESEIWLKESASVLPSVTSAYSETIPNLKTPITKDFRFIRNSHIVNPDFSENPKYLAACYPIYDSFLLVLSVLYVYPSFRGNGFGQHLLKQVQGFVNGNAVVQVAVSVDSIDKLHNFYTNNGFQTLGVPCPDAKGNYFVDYFWAPYKISLKMAPSGKEVLIHHQRNLKA